MMGIDLKLLPFDADSEFISFSHTVLGLNRRSELWPIIELIEQEWGLVVPPHFSTFVGHHEGCEETGYGDTQTTAYGQPLRYVLAQHLNPLSNHRAVTDDDKNRAIWAYIRELRDDTKIALFWD
jgi:hypothetical protein